MIPARAVSDLTRAFIRRLGEVFRRAQAFTLVRNLRKFDMTREEALKELDELSRAVKSGPVSQQEVLCRQEMKEAARILSVAFERVRKRDPLYGNIRRTGALSPPPGRVPPA